eukprot:362899-Chlamydomonas_euryale.AAC.2
MLDVRVIKRAALGGAVGAQRLRGRLPRRLVGPQDGALRMHSQAHATKQSGKLGCVCGRRTHLSFVAHVCVYGITTLGGSASTSRMDQTGSAGSYPTSTTARCGKERKAQGPEKIF